MSSPIGGRGSLPIPPKVPLQEMTRTSSVPPRPKPEAASLSSSPTSTSASKSGSAELVTQKSGLGIMKRTGLTAFEILAVLFLMLALKGGADPKACASLLMKGKLAMQKLAGDVKGAAATKLEMLKGKLKEQKGPEAEETRKKILLNKQILGGDVKGAAQTKIEILESKRAKQTGDAAEFTQNKIDKYKRILNGETESVTTRESQRKKEKVDLHDLGEDSEGFRSSDFESAVTDSEKLTRQAETAARIGSHQVDDGSGVAPGKGIYADEEDRDSALLSELENEQENENIIAEFVDIGDRSSNTRSRAAESQRNLDESDLDESDSDDLLTSRIVSSTPDDRDPVSKSDAKDSPSNEAALDNLDNKQKTAQPLRKNPVNPYPDSDEGEPV